MVGNSHSPQSTFNKDSNKVKAISERPNKASFERLMHLELQEMIKKGVCYCCEENYCLKHVCENKKVMS